MSDEQTSTENNQPTADQPVATAATVKSLSGFDEGHVLPDGDIVKGSYDDAGNLTGWHKEPGAGEPHPTEAADGAEQPIVPDPNEPEPTPPNADGETK